MMAVAETFKVGIPEDRVLSEIKTVGHLVDALEAQRESETSSAKPVKGIPALELFSGQKTLPPNMTLINYRKKRWSDDIAEQFVRKAYQ